MFKKPCVDVKRAQSALLCFVTIGNPLSYGAWSYTWKAGRMLHSMVRAGTSAQFTYDHTGLRVKKSVNGEDTLYTLNGKNITHICKGNTQMHFFYDVQGRPSIMRYNGIDYMYLHNLQGDIVAIVDQEGKSVVEYAYDAWGRQTSFSTSGGFARLGLDNPFRYRGYVYDEETGLYYLRSRYYDPEWGRWLNWDTLLGVAGGLLTHNAFCYCFNNPVNKIDSTGLFPFDISEVSTIPVEQLPYMAHKLAGEPYDESMMTTKYAIKGEGKGRARLPNGDTFEITYNGIRNYYHMDIRAKSAVLDALNTALTASGYKFGKYTPVVPIILELDYKGIKVRTFAVLHPNHRKGHEEMCVWLYNSDGDPGGGFGPQRISYGRDNDVVTQAPSKFGVNTSTSAKVDKPVRGPGGGGWLMP